MALFLTFLLGIANFGLHKAVLESRHPLLGAVPWLFRPLGGRASLALEFAALLGAMLLAGRGMGQWVPVYAGYTALNAGSAWLILSGRV